MAYLTFALTVLLLPFLPAGATIPRWGLLAVAVPAIILWRTIAIPTGAWLVAAYVTLSLVVTGTTYSGLNDYCTFWILLGAFCIGRSMTDLKPVFVGAALGLWVNSAATILHALGVIHLPQTSEHATLFMNENSCVEAAAMVTAAIVIYRVWWLLPGLLPSLLINSRGPIVALALVGGFAMWKKSKAAVALCVLAVAAFFAYRWLEGRFNLTSLQERYNVLRDVLPGLTVFGHGIGSFQIDYAAMQVHTNALAVRFDHPHSDPVQIVFELGVAGAFFIALVVRRMGRLEPDAAWYALAVFLVEGCFAFPLYMPVTGFLAALCAGYLSRPGAVLRRGVDPGGCVLQNWHVRAPHRAF